MDEENKQIQAAILDELRAIREQSAGSSLNRPTGTPGVASATPSAADDAAKSLRRFSDSAEEADEELEALGISSRGLNRAQIDQLKSAYEYKKALDTQVDALKKGTDAVKDLGSQLISQQRGFEKYGKGLENLTSEVGKFAGTLGPAGKVIGGTIAMLGKLGAIYMDQADKLLKANDSIAQFGTAGSFTTKELMQMAHGAGITSKNMELLVNPIKSLGPALTSLGSSTGEGVKAFTTMAKITNEQREGYQRLGVSQEQLIQNQADYVKLQMMSGRTISNELKDRQALQRASLEYTDSLLNLANLTGQDVESLKKKQQDANRAIEAQVAQIQLESKARRLEAAGRKEEAEAIRKEAAGRKKAIDMMAGFDENSMKGVREFLSTGTIVSEEAQALVRLGLGDELKKLKQTIASGGDAEMATAKFQDAYNKKLVEATDKVGFAASRVPELAKQFSMSENSMATAAAKRNDSMEKELEASRKRTEEAKKPGKDPAQDARATLTTAEIKAGKALDSLTAAANPLLSGFNALTIASTLAAAAVGALAVSKGTKFLGGIAKKGTDAVKGAWSAIRGAAPLASGAASAAGAAAPVATTVASAAAPAAATAATTAATTAAGAAAPAAATAATTAGAAGATGAASSAASALGKLAGPLSKLTKAAPLIGTVMSVGSGVIDAYQGIKKADKDLKEGKITKEEARVEKGEAVGGGVGTAAGGTGGAWAGAAAGAAIGSAVPVVGTVIGGLLGAALGGWMGANAGKAIGEVAGGGIAKMTADADKEVDKAKKESEKDSKSKDATDKLKDAKSSDVVKVHIVNPLPLPVNIVKGIESLSKLTPDKKPIDERLLASALGPVGMLGSFVKTKFTEKQPEIKETSGIDKKLIDQLGEAASFSPDIMKQFGLTAGSLEDKKPEIVKDERTKLIPVSIQRVDDPNMLKALGQFGASKPKPIEEPKKPLMGAGTLTGIAMGSMLGPLGMLVGGLVGSRFNKPEQKSEQVKKVATTTSKEESKEFTFSETELAKKDEKLYKEYVNRREELFKKELEKRQKNLEPDASAHRIKSAEKLARTAAQLEAQSEFAERAAKVGAATITKSGVSVAKTSETPKDLSENVKKEKLDLPKASEGGSFSGPKEGYPVLLHGDEDVIPRKNNVVKKPTEIETLGTLGKTALEAPKQFVQQKVSEATGFDMAGDAAAMVTERILKKVAPQLDQLQRLSTNVQTAGKVEGIDNTGEGDPVQQIMDILKVIPKTGALLDKVEGVQKIFSSDTGVIEKLWEAAKLLHPAARILGTVIDVAKPMLAEMNKSKSQPEETPPEASRKIEVVQSTEDESKEKKVSSIPKAAVGGVFQGPKSGYPVELHGKEMVVPMGTGTKTANLPADDEEEDSPHRIDWEEESKDFEKFAKSMNDSDTILKKFTTTVLKLNELNEKDLDNKEELDDASDNLKNAFSGAFVNLKSFSSKLKISLDGGKQSTSGGESGEASTGSEPVRTGSGGTLVSGSGTPVMSGGSGPAAGPGAAKPVPAKPVESEATKPMTEPPKPGSMGEKTDTKAMQGALVKELGSMGITDPKAQANIMAQVKAESNFKPRSEELEKYSAKTLFKLYGPGSGNKVRFQTLQDAQAVVDKGPEAVGNVIYGGRMGNAADEGYKYRGRGLIQLTGKSNYEKYGKLIGVDLVKDPDLANDPAVATKLAAVYFKEKEKKGVDLTDIGAVGKSVGYAGGAQETAKRAQYAKAYESELGSGSGTQYAQAKDKIPQAKRGGVFEGPESGYIVELHGNEIVIPTEKIASVAQKELESVTKMAGNLISDQSAAEIPDTSEFSNFMSSGLDVSNNLNPAIPDGSSEIFVGLTDKIQKITEDSNVSMLNLFKSFQEDLKSTFSQILPRNETPSTPTIAGVEEDKTSIMIDKLDQIITQLSQSNSTQDKLLQQSRV